MPGPGRGLGREVVHELDRAFLELAQNAVGVARVEPERLEHLGELRLQQRAALLGRVDEPAQLVAQLENLQLDRQRPSVIAGLGPAETPRSRRFAPCTITGVLSSSAKSPATVPTSTSGSAAHPLTGRSCPDPPG